MAALAGADYVRVISVFVLLSLALIMLSNEVYARQLVKGVDSYICWLPGNPWLAATPIQIARDPCAWNANGFAERS